jgi:predicted ATPase
MLNRMTIRNLTVFSRADLEYARHLNVIVGENGSGKTHLLKIAYTLLAVSAEERRKLTPGPTPKSVLQIHIADKLVKVFRPEQLGHLVRRGLEQTECDVGMEFDDHRLDVGFAFRSNSESEVEIKTMPTQGSSNTPVYFPTRELLTIYPNFVSIYEGRYLEFEESWRDTCVLLGAPLEKGAKEARIRKLLKPLEKAMDGAIELDKNGRFYLKERNGRLEMPLVAEGLRKLGMLARLIANGTLLDKGYLFWDEPDANLNPKLVKQVAESIISLSKVGIQVFIATHSLFLLRELEILLSSPQSRKLKSRFFGLHRIRDGAQVQQGGTVEDIGDIAALDEQLEQSDRFLEKER